ncbi:DUF1223 domain-containing protein [Pseudophaeobacter sp.]|uniref:DUF1223 domain-containing protein n=1 Tax=Pseudophaeobacter sp. TaxID=1971739 RepID=UPI0032990E44
MKLTVALVTAFVTALCFSLSGAASAQQHRAPADEPVVVELFTSQGCSSCPPADALLKKLAEREDVLALALHVDYWDYIGWKDIFASPVHTNRQKGYAQVGGRRMIYTPQMIVMGYQDVSGGDAMALAEAIAAHQTTPRPVALEVRRGDGQILVSLKPREVLPDQPVSIQIVRYTALKTVDIARGELAGHRLDYANVVDDLQHVKMWDGQQAIEFTVDFDGALPAAVLVQQSPFGTVLAARRIE